MNEGLKAPEVQASIAKLGLETRSVTPQQFAAALADETRLWEAAVKESGVQLD
jgi:tripartite-type tricarboxylate transporter receptor subunit TctC